MESVFHSPFAPQPIRVRRKPFTVAQVIEGEAGRILFSIENMQHEISRLFYSPKESPSHFFELYTKRLIQKGKNGQTYAGATIIAGEGKNFDVCTAFGDSAFLASGSNISDWVCLPETIEKSIHKDIRTGKTTLYSLPVDHTPKFAFSLAKELAGKLGYLVLTAPFYSLPSPYAPLKAYVLSYDSSILPCELLIHSNRNARGYGATRTLLLEKNHRLRLNCNGSKKLNTLDGKKIQILWPEIVAGLVGCGLIPGVPKTPTPLLTPLASLKGPVG